MTGMAGDERSPWRRDPWIAAVAVAVFAGVLMMLPVPEPADPPGGPLPETNFAVVNVTVFDGEEFRPHRDVLGRGRPHPRGRAAARACPQTFPGWTAAATPCYRA